MPDTNLTTGRVLLLKPGDALLIAGIGPAGSEEEADQLHDLLAQLKGKLSLTAVWAFEADIDIAKAEIATRLKIEEEK